MDYSTAMARLQKMTQWDVAPALTSGEVAELLLLARTRDANGYEPYDAWAASTVYAVGSAYAVDADGLAYPGATIRIPTVSNGHIYAVTVGGTSGASQPTWPTTSGATVVDGGVTWTERGSYLWTPTYALRRAAGEGFLWKAAKVAALYEVSVGTGKTFKRDQQWKMLMGQAAAYGGGFGGSGAAGGGGGIGSIRLGSASARA